MLKVSSVVIKILPTRLGNVRLIILVITTFSGKLALFDCCHMILIQHSLVVSLIDKIITMMERLKETNVLLLLHLKSYNRVFKLCVKLEPNNVPS